MFQNWAIIFQNLLFGLAIVCGLIAGAASLMVFTDLTGDPDWEWLFKILYLLFVALPIGLIALFFWTLASVIKRRV